jgi:hypothetical protein
VHIPVSFCRSLLDRPAANVPLVLCVTVMLLGLAGPLTAVLGGFAIAVGTMRRADALPALAVVLIASAVWALLPADAYGAMPGGR